MEMEQLPRITATVTIVQTGEKHEVEFDNVIEMLSVVSDNINLAQLAYDCPIDISDVQVEDECDDAYFAYSFTDTNELYMTVAARRHFLQ